MGRLFEPPFLAATCRRPYVCTVRNGYVSVWASRLRVILSEQGACDARVEVLRRRAKRVEQNRDVVNGAGSRNDFCWLTKVNVTFPMESQPHSIRDPFLARPSVVLVGFCSARKLPHKNFDSGGTACLPSLRMTHRVFVRCEQSDAQCAPLQSKCAQNP